MDLRAIEDEVRASFADFAAKRARNDPGFAQRTARVGRRAGRLSAPFALLGSGARRIHGRRFLFLSGRFEGLLAEFSAAEAALIGGPRDRAMAAALGLPFVFTGDLAAAASAILFDNRWIPTTPVLRRWQRFFARQADPCYLVVPSDTLPISLLLVKLASHCANLRVVCVQHGLFNAGFDEDDIEGRNCAINLVYSPGQAREMQRRMPGAIAEPMGLPEQLACEPAPVPGAAPREAILVGPGTLEDRGAYRATLQVYRRAAEILEAAGFEVAYRPHPSEAGVDEGKDEFRQDLHPRRQLLTGARKAFVGFNSTLLYEAQMAGHVVAVLDDAGLPGYSLEPIGVRVAVSRLEQLPSVLGAPPPGVPEVPAQRAPVRERFEQALARAESRMEVGGGRGSGA